MATASPALQRAYWNRWNESREKTQGRVSHDQERVVRGWLEEMGRHDLKLVEAGCGSGWMCETLSDYGRVTGVDISDEVLRRAARRLPQVKFIAGDFTQVALETGSYDFVVSLETLAHVPDQPAFVAKMASVLKPGGQLMLATQNRPALERNHHIPAPQPCQLRHWTNREELRTLIEDAGFEIEDLFSITPKFDSGPLKLVTSEKVLAPLTKVGLGSIVDAATHKLEESWLGWTLMVRARKPA
jgi:2-polyprenyl-3-methyl-5-hydroxy-6-metoxy-1,4-benzoquinol methylase